MQATQPLSRRRFLQTSATIAVFPQILTQSKADRLPIVGEGNYRYEVIHHWAKLPSQFTWQTTHNVAVDRDGFLYVIHEGKKDLPDHPSIFVFDPQGRYVRSFGSQFQGGGHGLEVRQEGGEQFLYVTAYQHLKRFAKLTLTGERVWEKRAPMVSELYAPGESKDPQQVWGRDRFMPTNFAFHPDGGYYVTDGYGAWTVHRYNENGDWVFSFGKPGTADGEFQLPHGIWIDDRDGTPKVVVADRVNARLQWFTLGGRHLKTVDGMILPANIDTHGSLMLVPDLSARVTLLDGQDRIVTHLGEDPDWREQVLKDNRKLRSTPDQWVGGKFIHPHDACFDHNGDIFVAEWVATGRITKLRHLS